MDQRTLRVFISSPSDVRPERAVAERVVQRLAREFAYHFRLEPVLWEREPLLAGQHFQDGIVAPSETDIVVVVLWSRLGVPLPVEQYTGPLSGAPVTGTEWEFEDALASYRERRAPDLLMYRKRAPVLAELDDDAGLDRQREQKRLVETFFRRWFLDQDARSFTAAFSEFTETGAFEAQLETHLRELLRKRLDTPSSETAPAEIRWHRGSPFRGLQSFEPEHADIFFGRGRARHELRELLERQAERGSAFVLVMGASGSGKSSLVKAGLLPDLQLPGMIGRVALCRHAVLRPADLMPDLLEGLAGRILQAPALPELKALQYDRASLTGLLEDAPQQAVLPIRQGLARAGEAAGLTELGEARLVLVVDQLEELFTLEGLAGAERERFVAALESLAGSGLVYVVATLRSDFFDRLETLPRLARLAEGEAKYLLVPPDEHELGQIIRQPAREAGLSFETDERAGHGLDEVIQQAAAKDPAALPLLEFVLEQLWQRRTAGGVLTFEAYAGLGGLEGALGQRAEAILRDQPDDVQGSLPQLLRAVVTVGQGAKVAPTARTVPLAAFAEGSAPRRLVEAFLATGARLLVADGDENEPHVRLAHEALLTHWPRAAAQIAADRADLQLRTRLEQQAALWRERNRDPSLLLAAGLPLSEAEDLLRRRGEELDPELVAYVEQSSAAASEAQRRRVRRLQAVAAILALFAVLAGIGGWYGYAGQQEAEARAAESEARLAETLLTQSRYVARVSRRLTQDGAVGDAMALALEVLPRDLDNPERPFSHAALAALQEAVWQRREVAVLRGHSYGVASAAFSPDGRHVVTGSHDDTARLWALDGAEVAALRGHEDGVTSAAFSPDGRLVVTASSDGTARLWTPDGAEVAVLRGHEHEVTSVAFSPDGRHVITASRDDTARLWTAEGQEAAVLRGHRLPVMSAAFSPDGRHVVTASWDGTARIWTLEGQEAAVLRGHEGEVMSAAFSPDGGLIVTASADRTARLWTTAGTAVAVLHGHNAKLTGAAFSPDGQHVLTASTDGMARLWTLDGDETAVLRGHEQPLWGLAFSPDGRHVVTASRDRTARLWTLDGTEVAVLGGHDAAVISAVFSPDGRHVVTASGDGTARLWTVDGQGTAVLRPHKGKLSGVTFSPDGRHVLTAASDGTARLWTPKGDEVAVLRGHRLAVVSAAFSPDGRHMVTASNDATARLWTLEGKVVAPLRGHVLEVICASFSPDGQHVVTASPDGTARLWTLEGDKAAVLRGHDGPLWTAAFSVDGRLVVTASNDGTARLWTLEGKEAAVLRGHGLAVVGATFSPDGQHVVTASWDRTARLWGIDGKEAAILRGHEGAVNSAAFGPGGRLVATASADRTARLWTVEGQELAVLRGHEGAVDSAVFSPDGRYVLTASRDNTARLWTVDGTEMAVLRGHDDAVTSAAFSPDGRYVATASADGTARLWPLFPDPQALIDHAGGIVDRLAPLSKRERCDYYLDAGDCAEVRP